jgi:hypothetical protein
MLVVKSKERELVIMQRLQLEPDEKLTRKEYIKRKKKQSKKLKKRSKITYIMISVIMLLCVYVFSQFYIYSKSNNYKYVEGEGVGKQDIYNVYYVVDGYTYDPVYSLNSINSNGFNEKTVYSNSGFVNIVATQEYIYGIKESSLCRLSKQTSEIEVLVEKDVFKYKVNEDRIYYTCESSQKLKYIDINTKEIKDIGLDNISEILVDKDNIYIVKDEKTKKILVKYDKEGQNKKDLVTNANVSYIIQDESNIYYVNKNEGSQIYKINKDGSGETKFDDVVSVSDKGDIKEIDGSKNMFVNGNFLYYINVKDGNTLWKINIETKEKEKVISVAVEILQDVNNTIYYKVKNEMGVYLFNYETNFMSQITKRQTKDFFVDQTEKIENNTKDAKNITKT